MLVPKLIEHINTTGITLIHAHTELMGILAKELSNRSSIPYVVSLHGVNTAQRLNTDYYLTLLRNMLDSASRVVIVGEPIKDYYSLLTQDCSHFRVVFNGFRFNSRMNINEKEKWHNTIRFISVSNLHKGKGIDINLAALSQLEESGFHNWEYTVIGGGRECISLMNQSKKLGLENKVKFLGECAHSVVYDKLGESDVFILPSYQEAFGIVYLEAMATGLLTVAVKGQGASAFITHNLTGLLVEPRSISSLCNALKKVFLEQGVLIDIAKKGQLRALNDFTWPKHAQKLIEVYREVS